MSASTSDSTQLSVYSLQNENGLTMSVTNLGGKIISLWVPDKDGTLGNIVLGYDSIKRYLKGNPYFGAIIGRYGNRIAKGKFLLEVYVHTKWFEFDNFAIYQRTKQLKGFFS